MDKGQRMETVLFIGSILLCLVTGYLFFKPVSLSTEPNTSDFLAEIRSSVQNMAKENKTFSANVDQSLTDLSARISNLERHKSEHIVISFDKPLHLINGVKK